MTSFAAAARQADASRLPVVEGIAIRLAERAGERAIEQVQATLHTRLGGQWEAERQNGRWVHLLPVDTETPPPLDATWDAVREIAGIRGVAEAEPLLLIRLPAASQDEAEERFGVWGLPYDRRIRELIEQRSAKHDWSLEQMKIAEAWALWRQKHGGNAAPLPGTGTLVAHPDTGYTHHPQIDPVLAGTGRNFVDPERPNDARDDLKATGRLEQPGHGTGTASVIASPSAEVAPDADVLGVAPGARIRPLRVSTSVIHLSFKNLIKALDDAVEHDAHVVSMSLGGPQAFGGLRDAVRRALDNGTILVAAAGNYFPLVFFPAAVPGVVACAASNPAVIPWRFSGFGDEVVITAPGERVWRAKAELNGGAPVFDQSPGTGTSHATASVAGVAALWLSFHGRDNLIATYGRKLLPFAFQLHLQRTADNTPDWVRGGKGGFGAGIVNAANLLGTDPPSKAEVATFRDKLLERDHDSLIDVTLRELVSFFRVPTHGRSDSLRLAANNAGSPGTPSPEAVHALVRRLLGGEPDDPAMLRELASLIAGRPSLHSASLGAAQRVDLAGGRAGADGLSAQAIITLQGRLLQLPLSTALRQRIVEAQVTEKRNRPQGTPLADIIKQAEPAPPARRRLRAFAFDPSLATRLDTYTVNSVTISVPFEQNLQPGPVGDYLEVVDVDPATGCAYLPVDLNHPALVAQDGLPQSEGNPQFHQQMVYAVAMKTVRHFEDALGRPIFWSSVRPWSGRDAAVLGEPDGRVARRDRFVHRLRLYPHALREANAYYDPDKRAILFGYFPAGSSDPGQELPGAIVFTCLSHDIIAHEMTHAILDGMHVYFTEPTNPDVFAFHEAFADIVALFQHFTYPEVLRDQIARTRGDLTSENLLGQLARQFGVATGGRHALRDAIGGVAVPVTQPGDAIRMVEAARVTPAGKYAAGTPEPPPRPAWMRYQPDPFLLPVVEEAHARGAILVAAVFDAFLAIYGRRVADLTRIATGGTGVLPAGQLHPDLVNRMALEAADTAGHVLTMCIRAMDHVPPVDITFGEFLRALITADHDLVPDDERLFRVAFIDAFRQWGIYPRDVRTLSEESLLWHGPDDLYLFGSARDNLGDDGSRDTPFVAETKRLLRQAALAWQPGGDREAIFGLLQKAQRNLHSYLANATTLPPGLETVRRLLPGIDVYERFNVANLRPSRRVGPGGEFMTEIVFEVIQPAGDRPNTLDGSLPFRGGVTVVVGLDDWKVRYSIYKRRVDADGRNNQDRQDRQEAFTARLAATLGASPFGAAEYRCADVAEIDADRTVNREAMRASSCACRAGTHGGNTPLSPFALLHRGRE